MKIGLVGYLGSGKSSLFEWLTGVTPDPALSHTAQAAMATVAEPRLEQLRKIYNAKKVTPAALELVDTPGLSRSQQGNAARLAMIREADCLVLVVAAFDGSDPMADMTSFDEDLVLADMEVLSGRIERVEEALKKPISRQQREQLRHEQKTLAEVLAAMEAGKPLRQSEMNDEQLRLTRSFRLLSEKPSLVVVNTADDEENAGQFAEQASEGVPVSTVPVRLELELAKMSPEDRAEFEEEMGVGGTDRNRLIRTLLDAAGRMLFFTVNQREVRAWLLGRGGTALEAAAIVHTDLARGFIRAEVMSCSDLIRVGSEREARAQHLVRQEPKTYIVQDDEILLVRFSV